MIFVTVSMCVFTPRYHAPMYFNHSDEASKQNRECGRIAEISA